ncbi:hypothetical protein Lepto7375DRAFT_8227 [Leptolyngbya sp. PCC 7375]|nr:hypothetical protein Lepto7375DRAFT_8227 [Leptolyngbya sp. PCC 7375]
MGRTSKVYRCKKLGLCILWLILTYMACQLYTGILNAHNPDSTASQALSAMTNAYNRIVHAGFLEAFQSV